MIHRFRISNFYSINQPVEINFVIRGKLAKTAKYHHTDPDTGLRLALIKAVMGPNASGKTTLLRGLALTKWLMTESFCYSGCKSCGRTDIPHKSFALNNKSDPGKVEIDFKIGQVFYQYSCSLNKRRILSEKLSEIDYSKKRATTKTLFSKQWQKKRYLVEDNFQINLPNKYLGSPAMGNTTIIAHGKHLGHKLSSKIYNYWDNVETNVDVSRRWMSISYFYQAHQALDHYSKRASLRDEFTQTLKQYELGIEGFDKHGRITHKFDNKAFKLPLHDESAGTQQLIKLLKMVDTVLKNGGAAIIDEFDAYLHSKMFIELLERFQNPKFNPKYAQLILTTHDLEALDHLDKQQIVLSNRNSQGSSIFRDLSSFPGRPEDNLRAKYSSGKYDSWPELE